MFKPYLAELGFGMLLSRPQRTSYSRRICYITAFLQVSRQRPGPRRPPPRLLAVQPAKLARTTLPKPPRIKFCPPPPQIAAQAVVVPEALGYLKNLTWFDMWAPAEPLPAYRLAALHCLLAIGHTSDVTSPCSRIALTSEQLISSLERFVPNASRCTAYFLASRIPAFIKAVELDPLWRAPGTSVDTLMEELRDGELINLGSDVERRAAMLRRLPMTFRTWQSLGSILSLFPQSEQPAQLDLLASAYLPNSWTQPFQSRCAELNRLLEGAEHVWRQALDPADGPPLTGDQVIELLLADRRQFEPRRGMALPEYDGAAPGSSRGDAAGANLALKDETMQRALHAPEFVSFQNGPLSSIDVDSEGGRHDILDYAYSSGSLLITHFLVFDPKFLRTRSEVFSTLHHVMGDRLDFFSKCQATDPTTGVVPELLQSWLWSSTQMDLFQRGNFTKVNWVNRPDGALSLLELNNVFFANVSRDQWWKVKSVVELIRDFGGTTFSAFGYPAAADAGYTWAAFCDHHIRWIEEADALPPGQATEWLEFGARAVGQALTQMGLAHLANLNSSDPASRSLTYVLPFDCRYTRELASKRTNAMPLLQLQRAFPGLLPQATPRLLLGVRASGGGSTTSSARARPSAGSNSRGNNSAHPAASNGAVGNRGRATNTGRGGGRGSARGSPHAPAGRGAGSAAGRGSSSRARPNASSSSRARAPSVTHAAAAGGPGSRAHLAVWLVANTSLMIAYRVYDVAAIAQAFGIPPVSRCWPVLLSTKPADEPMQLCPHHSKPAHGNMASAAHSRPSAAGLDWAQVIQANSRPPTKDERRRSPAAPPPAAHGLSAKRARP